MSERKGQRALLWTVGGLLGAAGASYAFGSRLDAKATQRAHWRVRMLAGEGASIFEQGGSWYASLPVSGDCLATLPLDGAHGAVEASEAVIALMAEGAPEVCDGEVPSDRVSIIRDPSLGWAYHIPCPECGGYDLSLEIPEAADPLYARAMTAHQRPLPDECLACRSAAIRDGETEGGMWYDFSKGSWQWAQPVGGGVFLAFSLGLGYYTPPELLERLRQRLSRTGPYDHESDD
jgi:hypothetical protein